MSRPLFRREVKNCHGIHSQTLNFTFPGQGSSYNRALYKILTMVWMFCGLAWLATILNIADDFVKSLTTKVDADVDKSKKTDDDKKDNKVCYFKNQP